MKSAFRNKTDEKRPKMAIFKLLVLSYICSLPYIFLSFIPTILPSSMLCENTRKSLNQQIWVWYISNFFFFSRLFKYGGRVRKVSSTPSCKFFYAFGPKLSALRKYYDF